jgi:hypothetical protein
LTLEGNARSSAFADLDCLFCGRWFTNFYTLGDHTVRTHGDRLPTSADPRRGIGDGFRRESVTERQTRMASDKVSKPEVGKGTSGEFLKAKMVGKLGAKTTLTLMGTGEERAGNFGPQITVGCKMKGKDYQWSFGLNGGNHTRLFDRFGSSFKKWKGVVKVEVKEFNGNEYLAVID